MTTFVRFTEEESMFQRSVERFVAEKIKPVAAAIDREDSFPRKVFGELGDQGFLGLRYPERYGGSDANFVTYLLMIEELARGSLAVAAAAAMQSLMGTDFVFRCGTEEHRERLLVPAIRGEKVGAFAMSEPNAGSDLARMETVARPDGDGGWRITGRKMWVTNGTVADFFTVAANSDREQGLKGIRFFLVEKGNPGLTIGRKIPKLGTLGCDINELALEDCLVDRNCQLGERGLPDMKMILDQIRVMTGALSVGLSRAALEFAVQYSKQRVCFNQPIAKFQAIQHKIAGAVVDLEASRALVYGAGRMLEAGQACFTEACVAKLFASEAANRIADAATRIAAGYGFATEFPAERFYRDARFLLIGGGTSELLLNLIAKSALD
jgi:butyryl-CoA dehydrogenase